MHHIVREIWEWNVELQDYVGLAICSDDCAGCKLGIPL